MEFSNRLGKIGTINLSPHENTLTIAFINIHYLCINIDCISCYNHYVKYNLIDCLGYYYLIDCLGQRLRRFCPVPIKIVGNCGM